MNSMDELEAADNQAILDAGAQTEQEMRDATVPTFDTIEELSAFITGLVDRPHSYGTCVYAMSHAAVAAFMFVSSKLGVTGFQASCADMDILMHTRRWKWGRLLNYDNLLYPQYCNVEHFPDWRSIIENPKHAPAFAQKARENLQSKAIGVHPNVIAHWQWLASLAPEEDRRDESVSERTTA